MKRLVGAVALSATLLLSTAGVSVAVTDGELDGDGHPYVGLMVAQDADGNPLWRCSGTLISATLFLTAGHCTEAPAAHVEIWFDADVESGIPANGYPFDGQVGGTPYTHPNYDPSAFWLHDLGMVVLDKPVKQRTFGILPTLDLLDQARTKRELSKVGFTAVGYGLQQAFPDAASWKEQQSAASAWLPTRGCCRSTEDPLAPSPSCSRTTRTPVGHASETQGGRTSSAAPVSSPE